MDDLPAEALGPRMVALPDGRRRRFAWLVACGANPTQAAREAGYADPGGHSASIRVQAHNLMHDQKVLDAILEAGRKVLQGLSPLAITAARAVLQDKKHPAHARMIETVLDRTGFGGKTEHTVSVEHTDRTGVAMVERIRQLAAIMGIDEQRLLGPNAPARAGDADAKVIEGTGSRCDPVEVMDETAQGVDGRGIAGDG
jgi:phage terminase small subunit